MINEEELKRFLVRWIQIPDEQGNTQMLTELEKVFFEDHTGDDAREDYLREKEVNKNGKER